MAEEIVKRLNYYNNQFLHAPDFIAEQEYHIKMRRKHNKLLHTYGIADGLVLTQKPLENKVLTVSSGTAVDGVGREIVLAADIDLDLSKVPALVNKTVYFTIAHFEKPTDHTAETGGEGDTRVTETPTGSEGDDPWQIFEAAETPPSDASLKLILGKVTLNASGEITSIDNQGVAPNNRRTAGVVGGELEALSLSLTDPARQSSAWVKMRLGADNHADLQGSLNVAGNILVSGRVDGRDVSADGDSLDGHIEDAGNPHNTTAAQVDAQGGANSIVTQINAGSGLIAAARIDGAIARDAEVNAKFDPASGHYHDGADSRKLTGLNSTHFVNLSGANLTGLSGSQITAGTVAEARIDPLIARTSRFDAATGHNHNGTNSKQLTPIDVGALASVSGVSGNAAGNVNLIAGSGITIAPNTATNQIAIASAYGMRMYADISFDQGNLSGAVKTVATTFEPKLILVTGGVKVSIGGLYYGAPLSGFVDRANGFAKCSAINCYKEPITGVVHVYGDRANYLCYFAGNDQSLARPRNETVYAEVSAASASSITVRLTRNYDSVANDPIEAFILNLSLVCLG